MVPYFQEQRSSNNPQVHFLGPDLRVMIFYLFPTTYIYVVHSDHVPLQYSVPPQQPLIAYKVQVLIEGQRYTTRNKAVHPNLGADTHHHCCHL